MWVFQKKKKKGFAAEGATVENVFKAFSGWGEIGIKFRQIFTKGDAGAWKMAVRQKRQALWGILYQVSGLNSYWTPVIITIHVPIYCHHFSSTSSAHVLWQLTHFIFFSQVMHNNWLFMNEARIYSAPTTSTAATFYVIHLAVGCVKSKALQRRRRESHRESPWSFQDLCFAEARTSFN